MRSVLAVALSGLSKSPITLSISGGQDVYFRSLVLEALDEEGLCLLDFSAQTLDLVAALTGHLEPLTRLHTGQEVAPSGPMRNQVNHRSGWIQTMGRPCRDECAVWLL